METRHDAVAEIGEFSDNIEEPVMYVKRGLAWAALVLTVIAALLRSFVIEDLLQRLNAYMSILHWRPSSRALGSWLGT